LNKARKIQAAEITFLRTLNQTTMKMKEINILQVKNKNDCIILAERGITDS